MNVLNQRLSNGVELAVRETHSVDLVSIQCWVGVGSLDEAPDERGMSHLLEHMLFKGTAKRGVGEIAKTVEMLGGDINAYTSFDRTVYYLTLSPKYLEQGLEILSDAIYQSAFDPDELAREKEVVLEEIKRSYDDPSFLLGRKSFAHVFAGCEAERPIFGSEESVKAFSRDSILAFYRRWYQPNNLSVVIVGAVATDDAKRHAETHFGIKRPAFPIERNAIVTTPLEGVTVELLFGDYQQARLELSFQGPSYLNEDSVHLDLAAFAMGSGDASRLHQKIKDELNLASAIGTSCYTPSFSGVFNVGAFPVLEKFCASVEAIAEEVFRFKYLQPMNEIELERARANTKADYWFQEETIEGQARSLGFGLTTPYKHKYDDVYLAMINSVSLVDTDRAVKRWLNEDRVVITALLPNGTALTKDEILAAYLRGVRHIKSGLSPAAIAKKTDDQLLQSEEILPGVTLAYRQLPGSRFFTLSMAKAGGLRAENASNAGIYSATSMMLCKASASYPYEELLDLIERTGANFDGFSGKDSIGLRMQCLSEHAEKLADPFFSCFFEPVFPEQQWRANKMEILDDIRTSDDHPASVCYRELQNLIFGSHPYHFPSHGKHETVATFTTETLAKHFNAVRDEGPWAIGCVSGMPYIEVKELLLKHLGEWSLKPGDGSFASDKLASFQAKAEHRIISKKREQTHIALAVRGLSWSDKDRYALDLLASIVSGQGGRLFINLRDKESLAYTVTSLCSFGVHPGLFGAYLACAPEKAEKAEKALRNELFNILQDPPSEEEITRAKNGVEGAHASEMQRSSNQAMNMSLMQLYGVGYDELTRYTKAIDAVQRVDLIRVAKRLLKDEHLVTVRVG